MVKPLAPPPRKDPQQRTLSPLLPPRDRSRSALKMAAAAARGQLQLQCCSQCSHMIYPTRDACPKCLCTSIPFKPIADHAELIAESTIQTTTNEYFRERTPWRMGTVLLTVGSQQLPLTVHLHDEVTTPSEVRLHSYLDKSGNAVLMAMPLSPAKHAEDDPQLRELTATPKHRRVLVTDIRTQLGQAVATGMIEAGATLVFAGNQRRQYSHYSVRCH